MSEVELAMLHAVGYFGVPADKLEEIAEAMSKGKSLSEALERLSRSKFRSSFHLSRKDLAYLEEKGPDVIRRHAEDFVRQKLAPADPANDGKQTPMSGHPVFKAMHATACCCRGCMEKWYHVPQHRELTAEEQSAVVKILTAWIEKQKDAQKQVRSDD